MRNVYCYRAGKADCFKVGRTKHDPDKRKRGFATGSPVKLELHRTIQTEHAAFLEKRIHHLLALKRAENGEFFNVTAKQLDEAVDDAIRFVAECAPVLLEAEDLSDQRPNSHMLEPSTELLDMYRELRSAMHDKALLDQRIDVLKAKLQVAIGQNRGITGVATWEWRDHWELDVSALREGDEELYVELFDKYKRNSGSRTFRIERADLAQMADVLFS